MTSELSAHIDGLLAVPTQRQRLPELFDAYSRLLIFLNNFEHKVAYEHTPQAGRYRIQDCQQKIIGIEQLFEAELSEHWQRLLGDDPAPSSLDKVSRFFYRIYQRMVSSELASLAQHNGRLCQVGVGAMPLSMLLYLEKTGFCVTGIDIDATCIDKATHGLQASMEALQIPVQRLNLLVADGADFDYSPFDVVVVSMTVSGRDQVLQRILDTCRQAHVQVVLRDTEGWKQFIYRPVGPPRQSQFELVVQHPGCPVSSAVYCVKP
ncbi:hypothetical protein C4J98_3383 [Pseudomonas orientalis]|uniref:nicotianamine synthase family protein n=1 Tax=Pseudomonas orientalis TaxID=76758 RepID=UPI000F57A11A|nr:nicotianamine synthase family protein [Pseudomonas orientalis]AZE84789.1 hypothetical protein C4J98_3383 [Pseudomonas orientalis]